MCKRSEESHGFVLSAPKAVSNKLGESAVTQIEPSPTLLVGSRRVHTKKIWLLIRIKHDKSIWWMPWH